MLGARSNTTSSYIEPNLWLGDWQDAKACREATPKVYIMTVAMDSPFVGNVHYKLVDGPAPGNVKEFADARVHLYALMHDQIPTLIHCVSGVSRSAAVVTGYLMQSRNMEFDDALNFVKKQRPAANPVPFFTDILSKEVRMI